MRQLVYLWILAVLFLAGCTGGSARPSEPTGIPGPNNVVFTPIPAAPAWRQPAEVMTRDNVSRIALLGRLDLPGTPSTLFSYALSPDSTRLAALSSENLIAWDLITGQRLYSAGRQGASFVFYSPDKTELYTVDPQGFTMVYDADRGSKKSDFQGHTDFGGAVAYYEDAGWLALGGFDGTVKVWDTFERTSLVTFDAHPRDVNMLAFSPDGSLLATASTDGIVKLWNWRERTLRAELDHNRAITRRMAFSPGGERLAVGTDQYISLWSVPDGVFLFSLQSGQGGASDVLLMSPNGSYLVNGGGTPDMNVWDAATGDLIALLPDLGGEPVSADFSPDGTLLLASELDNRVTLWDMTNITDETVVRADLDIGTNRVLYVEWTDDGFLMLFFDAAGPVYVWGIPPAPSE